MEGPGAGQAIRDPDLDPTSIQSRWASGDDEVEIEIRPVFPDRPLVLRPENPFHLLPEAQARVFVRVPLWIQVEVPGPRGTIRSADGYVLATSVARVAIQVDTQLLAYPELFARAAAPLLEVSERELVQRLHPERMRLRVLQVIDETPSARTFRLERTDVFFCEKPRARSAPVGPD